MFDFLEPTSCINVMTTSIRWPSRSRKKAMIVNSVSNKLNLQADKVNGRSGLTKLERERERERESEN